PGGETGAEFELVGFPRDDKEHVLQHVVGEREVGNHRQDVASHRGLVLDKQSLHRGGMAFISGMEGFGHRSSRSVSFNDPEELELSMGRGFFRSGWILYDTRRLFF